MNHSHLPHFYMKGYYQFITFRTADSTDSFLLKLAAESKPNREKQRLWMNIWIIPGKVHICKVMCMICFAIMPNHVHLLIKPLHKLSMVMQRVKGTSAKGINDMMGRRGASWEKNYYDKAIRDEKHFRVVYQYIKNNPRKLNLIGSATEVAPPEEVVFGSAASAAQVDVTKKKLLSATKVAPSGVGALGSAAQGECCLQQREHPGVLAAQEDVRFYGIYDA